MEETRQSEDAEQWGMEALFCWGCVFLAYEVDNDEYPLFWMDEDPYKEPTRSWAGAGMRVRVGGASRKDAFV